MRASLFLALMLVALSGCNTGTDTYSMAGTFTEDRTDEDIQEVVDLGEEHGGEVVILESFPEQFQVRGLGEGECKELRQELEQKSYIELVRQCTLVQGGANPY